MDQATMDFTQWLVQLGTGGAVAALIFWFYRRDVRTYTELWKDTSTQLMQVVKENTAASTSNAEVLRGISAKLDRDERRRPIEGTR